MLCIIKPKRIPIQLKRKRIIFPFSATMISKRSFFGTTFQHNNHTIDKSFTGNAHFKTLENRIYLIGTSKRSCERTAEESCGSTAVSFLASGGHVVSGGKEKVADAAEMNSLALNYSSLLSDITVAWDLGLVDSLQCLSLLEQLLWSTLSDFSSSTSTLHSIFISYLHVASFFYAFEENNQVADHASDPTKDHNWFKGVKSLHYPSLSPASTCILTNLFDLDSSRKSSRALDHLISFLVKNHDGKVDHRECINELFNLLFATVSTAAPSLVPMKSALAKKYVDLIAASPNFTCSALWIKLIENLRQERNVPPSLWISILYTSLVRLDTDSATFSNSKFKSITPPFLLDDGSTGWRDILTRSFQDYSAASNHTSSSSIYPLLQRMLEMSTKYPYTVYDFILAGLLYERDTKKLVDTCMYLLRSNDPDIPSISPLVFGSIIQHLFKVKEKKKAILLLHNGLEEKLPFPAHLIPIYPPMTGGNLDNDQSHSLKKKKRLSLFRHQKLFERVLVGLALGSFTNLSLSLLESSPSSLQKSAYLYNGLIMALLRQPSRHEKQSPLMSNSPSKSRLKEAAPQAEDANNVVLSRLLAEMKQDGIEMHSYTKYAFIQHLIYQGLEERAVEYLMPLLKADNTGSAAINNSREKQADFFSLIPKYGLQVPGLDSINGVESQPRGKENVELILGHMKRSNKPITTSFFNSFLSRLLASPQSTAEIDTEAKEEDSNVMQYARKLFESMKQDWQVDRDQHTFSIMAHAEFQRGNIDLGLVYVNQAVQENIPGGGNGMSACLYSLVCCALVQAGRVEESLIWFTRMTGVSLRFCKDDTPDSSYDSGKMIDDKIIYTPMCDSIGLENYFSAIIENGHHRLLFSLFSQHGARQYCRILRPLGLVKVIDYLLGVKEASYFVAVYWAHFLRGHNSHLAASLLEKAFRVHLSSRQVQGDAETWRRQTGSFVASLENTLKMSQERPFLFQKDSFGNKGILSRYQQLTCTILCLLHQHGPDSFSPSPNTRILLQISLLECIRSEIQARRFQVGDSGIQVLFSQLPVLARTQSLQGFQDSSLLKQPMNLQLPELADIEAVGAQSFAHLFATPDPPNAKGSHGPLVIDLLQIRNAQDAPRMSDFKGENIAQNSENQVTFKLDNALDSDFRQQQKQGKKRGEIDRLRLWCTTKNLSKVEAALERILFHRQQQDRLEQKGNYPAHLLKYLDLMIFHKLTVPGLEWDESPSLVFEYILSQGLTVNDIPPKFIGTWYATATKRYLSNPDLGRQIYKLSVERWGMDRQAVSRQIMRQLAASYQPEAAHRFYYESMRPAGLTLDFEAYEELITAFLHQDNIPQVLSYFGPLMRFDFSSGEPCSTTSEHSLVVEGMVLDSWPKYGQMKLLVWKVMSVFMKMKKIHTQSICNLLQTIYFEAALQGMEPKGKNLQVLVDYLIRQGQAWSMALIPYLAAPLQKSRYADVIKILQSAGVVKRAVYYENGVLQEFEILLKSLIAEGGVFGSCTHPTQLKIVWACVYLLRHLNWTGLKRPREYVDLATIVLAEFLRLQLPGPRIPSSLDPAVVPHLVKNFFAQCQPHLMKWEVFPATYKTARLGTCKQVTPLPVSSSFCSRSQQKHQYPAEHNFAIKLMPPLSEVVVGSLPKPATFTSVLDSTLPLVGNTLWLYNRIKHGALSPALSRSGYTFRQQYAMSLVKDNKDIPIAALIQRNPDLEKELEWVSGIKETLFH